ncbi:hypothetical protein POVCU2_0072010 [Plasmodium ovale curtisi]|uniref:Uncharacterized protein n=1 Tax=Plasmodium ovale curtisi TaxID=864141 RepID=A0A1A8VRB6_PLAOA|nr:hypothetical protein POVCU1_006740 [Plasmodium ovale curtisi]SBS92085.1 hypothetical protein POVCU2_0072010 [Plasmodium ovale curtisi]
MRLKSDESLMEDRIDTDPISWLFSKDLSGSLELSNIIVPVGRWSWKSKSAKECILVEVAIIQMRTLKTEVEKGFLPTVIVQELAAPKGKLKTFIASLGINLLGEGARRINAEGLSIVTFRYSL